MIEAMSKLNINDYDINRALHVPNEISTADVNVDMDEEENKENEVPNTRQPCTVRYEMPKRKGRYIPDLE